MDQKALTTQGESSRFALLEKLENNIRMAFRRGLEATRSMGADFNRIKEEQLYSERGYSSFTKYAEEYMGCTHFSVFRLIELSQAAKVIEDAGLILPANELQLAELAKLEPDRQRFIWKLVMDSFPQEEITARTIRIAVEQEQRRQQKSESDQEREEPKAPGRGVQTALDMDNGEQQKEQQESGQQPAQPSVKKSAVAVVAPGRITLTQDGEEALDRIRSLCGDQTAQGIEKGYISISERDLIKWADQTDVLVRNLEHYICDLRWSVRKALDYEERIIDGESTLNQLIVLARARGGRVMIEHQDFNELYKITIERTKILQ